MSVARWQGTALVVALAMALAVAGTPGTVAAQVMPQASQVSGVPLGTPELAVGTVTVRLFRERIGNSVASETVTLEAPQGTRTATTDAEGRAEFSGLTPGETVRVRAVVDGEALESQAFPIAAEGGTRVALIAGIAAAEARAAAEAAAAASQPARPGVVVLGNQSRIVVEFQDDNLTVFYLLDIVNGAQTPIDTGGPIVFDVPADATSTSVLDGSSPLGAVQGQKLIITGPFPPGSTNVQLAYRLPWKGSTAQITQTLPIAMDDVFVAVERVGSLGLSSPQIAQQQEGAANGQTFLMGVGPRLNAGDTLSVTLTGLPNRSTWPRDVGVAVASVILLWGLWAAVTGGAARAARTASLASQRDTLFDDLVALEQAHSSGRLGRPAYDEQRAELVLELERVMSEIDSRRPVTTAEESREGAPA